MAVERQNYVAWASVMTPLHVLAIGASLWRLFYRFRVRRLWWDDLCVAIALPVDLMYFIVMWYRWVHGQPGDSQNVRVKMYLISSLSFFLVLWIARISMALSLTRIIPSGEKGRRYTNGMAGVFFLCLLAIMLQMAIICGGDTSWHSNPTAQCKGTSWVSSLVLDLIGDLSLMIAPLVLLWRVQISKGQKAMVYSVFAGGIFTSLASICVHVFLLGNSRFGPNSGILVAFMSHIEASFALFLSNLLVIVAAFYRRFRNGQDIEAETFRPTFVGAELQDGEKDDSSVEKASASNA